MQTRHVLISLLVIAHISVGLVAWSMAVTQADHDITSRMFLAVVAISQIGLMAIWLSLGHYATPWRLAALVAVVVGWSGIWSLIYRGGPNLVFIFLPYAVVAAGVLGLARIRGLRLNALIDDPAGIDDERPWQFTLARLFAWTTSLAICLSLLSITFRHGGSWKPIQLSEFSVIILGSTIIVLLCLWLSFAGWRSLLVVLLIFLPVGYGLLSILRNPSQRSFLVMQIPLVVASLLVVRIAGYRLSWKWNQGSSGS